MRSSSAKVLIVEDEPRLRALFEGVVTDAGFGCAAARSAEEATRLMEREPHEIVLLDLHLPGIGGMDFFQTLRDRWRGTQVIVITGFGDLDAAQRAIRLDAVDFLTKPCPLRDLEVSLQRARVRLEQRVPEKAETSPEQARAESSSSRADPCGPTLAEVERQTILSALAKNRGNRSATAEELGISRRTLYYRLQEYARAGRLGEQ